MIQPETEPDCHESEARFARRIRGRLQRVLRSRPMHFSALLRCALNCDPALLNTVLDEAVSDRALRVVNDVGEAPVFVLADYSRRSPRPRSSRRSEYHHRVDPPDRFTSGVELSSRVEAVLAALPEPAPVYSQWWFSRWTYLPLVRLLLTLQPSRGETAFLACPTLAALFSQFSPTPVTVLDIDRTLFRWLSSEFSPTAELIPYDVCDQVDRALLHRFGLVFVDPPWGTSLLRLCLRRASQLVRVGGMVAISFPQSLTRPNLPGETQQLLHEASELGLGFRVVIPGATEYQIPLFEREAYSVVGIELTTDWRRGDLLLFRKSNPGLDTTRAEVPKASPIWDELSIGKRRFFLRRGVNGKGTVPLISPIPGSRDFRCATTSSRSEFMRRASLVSTQNGVAAIQGGTEFARVVPECLAELAHAEQRPVVPRNIGKRNLIAELAAMLSGQFGFTPGAD